MAEIYTHYDNLKVARNAPPEVIRAAYKTLTQKFHPDRNPGNAEAARIMVIINTSYAVLSDLGKRQEHDRWIAQQELLAAQSTKSTIEPTPTPPTIPTTKEFISHKLKSFAETLKNSYIDNFQHQKNTSPKPDDPDEYKSCCHCAEKIRLQAEVCRYCGKNPDQEVMKNLGITFNGEKYKFLEHYFSKRYDAIKYAKIKLGK